MKFILWDTYDVPDYALYFLTYGETDGLSREDVRNIENWLKHFDAPLAEWHGQISHIDFNLDEDAYFSNYPAFGLPSTCYEGNVIVSLPDDEYKRFVDTYGTDGFDTAAKETEEEEEAEEEEAAA